MEKHVQLILLGLFFNGILFVTGVQNQNQSKQFFRQPPLPPRPTQQAFRPCRNCGFKRDVNNPYPSNLPSHQYLPPDSSPSNNYPEQGQQQGSSFYPQPQPSQEFKNPYPSEGSSGGFNPNQNYPSPGFGSGSSPGQGQGTECQRQDVGGGRYKFICPPGAPSIKNEHVLWLTSSGGQSQVVDIEIPNYRIQELIKAGFKSGESVGSAINILLKRPETNVDAQIDQFRAGAGGPPKVQLQYESVDRKVVHFPNDQPYSQLRGPILPPLNAGQSG